MHRFVVLRNLIGTRRAKARVRASRRNELVKRGAISVEPFTLIVRTKRAADIRTFIVLESEPAQRTENFVTIFGAFATNVGILNAKHERSAIFSREEIIEERSARAADVQEACR